jgi:hypothetical protein
MSFFRVIFEICAIGIFIQVYSGLREGSIGHGRHRKSKIDEPVGFWSYIGIFVLAGVGLALEAMGLWFPSG